MKTKIKFSMLILFLGVIINFQDVYPFNVSVPSNVYVTLECSDYSNFEYAQFTNMGVPTWWQFEVIQGGGNLTIETPYCYPQWSFVVEPGVGWKNITSMGSVAISIGISQSNRI